MQLSQSVHCMERNMCQAKKRNIDGESESKKKMFEVQIEKIKELQPVHRVP